MWSLFLEKAYAYTIGIPIAKDENGNPITKYEGANSTAAYIIDLISLAINIAFSLAILMILWGAFKYATSGGDEAKVRDGKDFIVGAVVGFALLVLIKVLLPLVEIQ